MLKGPTSYTTRGLINTFEELKRKKKQPLYDRIVKELKKPRRNKRSVNLSKINRYTKKNQNVLVLGKVLGSGLLNHSLKQIIAFDYSEKALRKLKENKCKVLTLKKWSETGAKVPKKVKLIG